MAQSAQMEIDTVKAKLKDTWMAGDYDRFSRYMERGAREFYERLDVPADGRERLGSGVSKLTMTQREYFFDYPFPPADVVELFRQCYGPTHRAFSSLDEAAGNKLREELETLWTAHNRGGNEITFVSAEYLEVIAIRG